MRRAFLMAAVALGFATFAGAASTETNTELYDLLESSSIHARYVKANPQEAARVEAYWRSGGAKPTVATAYGRFLVEVAEDRGGAPPPPPSDPNTVPSSINATCASDVSAALQSWINGRPDGSILVFPAGCYRVEAGLALNGRNGLTLTGTGATLRATSVGDGHRSLIRATNGASLTVRGFRFEGGYSTPGTHNTAVQWSHGIEVIGTQTVLVENVTVVNVGGDCVYLGLGTQRTRDATIRALTCSGTGRNGVSLVAADRSRLEQSSTANVGYIGVDVEPNPGSGVDTATITGNTIGSYQINAFTIVGEAPVANVSFTSNQITAPTGGRIQVTGTSRRTNVTISGNTATQTLSYPQAIRLDNVDGATVTNNTLPTSGVLLRCSSVTGLAFSGNSPASSDGCAPPPPVGIQPGQSWQTAYNAAAPGAILSVAAGNHGAQTLTGTKAVTFRGVDGARLTSLEVPASNVTIDNVDIDGDGAKRTILLNGGDNNTYRNLEIRDNTDIQMVGNNGDNGTYDTVVFHDAVMTPAGETSGVHMECVWSNGPGLTVRNSRFYNCAVMDLFLTRGDWWGQPNVCCITLEDNIFEPSRRTSNQGTHFYGLGIHDNADNLDRYTVRGNRFDQPVNNTNPALASSVFCGNTGQAPSSWQGAC